MTAKLRIRNWERFQHYKDRNPPWIKLHVEILASEDWVSLDDASKLLMMVCMMVGAKDHGHVPNNPSYLKRVAYLESLPNLKPLIDCGFLEALADASSVLADARPEKETEGEGEKKENMSEPAAPVADLSKKISQSRRVLPYPEEFTAFWRAYPTDSIMSKKNALAAWQRLSAEDRVNAIKAIPAFKAYCASNPTYRPVHAERFLNQRRFEQLLAANAGSGSSVSDELRRMQALEREQHAEAASA